MEDQFSADGLKIVLYMHETQKDRVLWADLRKQIGTNVSG